MDSGTEVEAAVVIYETELDDTVTLIAPVGERGIVLEPVDDEWVMVAFETCAAMVHVDEVRPLTRH